MILWYCNSFYHFLLLCWGWWMDLSAFHHFPPSPPPQVWSSCFSSAASLEWKQKQKQMNIRVISQPSNRGREENQDSWDTLDNRDTLVPNCLPSTQPTLYCRTETVCQSSKYAPAPQRIIAALHVRHWRCFRYMHIYSVSIYYTFHMLCVALCTWQSIWTIHYSFCETFKHH